MTSLHGISYASFRMEVNMDMKAEMKIEMDVETQSETLRPTGCPGLGPGLGRDEESVCWVHRAEHVLWRWESGSAR